ncbi:MAG TPA: hypothetical protein DGM69_08180 [Chloroflexi bacterium]|nr:hypothetical protein [Chloroflexota bacterium]|tara:strand:+ start:942 stop:1109 length:168 start_codon:yes stop_codon:yes gene_type:complete
MNKINLEIIGLDCVDCARTLENSLLGMSDIDECSIDFYSGRLNAVGTMSTQDLKK